MKMVSNSNWKRTNVQLVSLACGLALATVVVAGGYEVMRDKDATVIISGATQPAGAVIDPTDFGSLGIEYTLAQQAANAAALPSVDEARGVGQPGEGTKSIEATLIDPTDFGSLGVESLLTPSYSTMADATYAATNPANLQSVSPVAVTAQQDALGIGQPGEGTQSVAATLIDPTDFASSFANHRPAQQFGTQADAVHATESWQSRASEAPLFGTMVDAVYVIEGDIQLP